MTIIFGNEILPSEAITEIHWMIYVCMYVYIYTFLMEFYSMYAKIVFSKYMIIKDFQVGE